MIFNFIHSQGNEISTWLLLLHLIWTNSSGFASTPCWCWHFLKQNQTKQKNNITHIQYTTYFTIFQCVIRVCGGLMFDPHVPQRRPCDKRCLDVDLKASQELPRRESPPTQQPVIPWRRWSESPWTEATCLLWLCCLLFPRWKQIKQKQLKMSCFSVFWGDFMDPWF